MVCVRVCVCVCVLVRARTRLLCRVRRVVVRKWQDARPLGSGARSWERSRCRWLDAPDEMLHSGVVLPLSELVTVSDELTARPDRVGFVRNVLMRLCDVLPGCMLLQCAFLAFEGAVSLAAGTTQCVGEDADISVLIRARLGGGYALDVRACARQAGWLCSLPFA